MCEQSYNRKESIDLKKVDLETPPTKLLGGVLVFYVKQFQIYFSCSLIGGKCAGNKPVKLIARRQ